MLGSFAHGRLLEHKIQRKPAPVYHRGLGFTRNTPKGDYWR